MEFKKKSIRSALLLLEGHGRENSEILACLEDLSPQENQMTRPELTKLFRNLFALRRWDTGIDVFNESDVAGGKIDFMKGRVAVQVSFNHYLRIGTELLRFQAISYSDKNHIDLGVYITVTDKLVSKWGENFMGSITFEKAISYYTRFRNVITVPILFIGLIPDF